MKSGIQVHVKTVPWNADESLYTKNVGTKWNNEVGR